MNEVQNISFVITSDFSENGNCKVTHNNNYDIFRNNKDCIEVYRKGGKPNTFLSHSSNFARADSMGEH